MISVSILLGSVGGGLASVVCAIWVSLGWPGSHLYGEWTTAASWSWSLARALPALAPVMCHLWVPKLVWVIQGFSGQLATIRSLAFLSAGKWRGGREKKAGLVCSSLLFGLVSFVKEMEFTLFLRWTLTGKCLGHRVLQFLFIDVSASQQPLLTTEAPRE